MTNAIMRFIYTIKINFSACHWLKINAAIPIKRLTSFFKNKKEEGHKSHAN
ncbi:MAG: hypothetical protein ACI9TY_001720 [Alphaproteobacteria bacterium]|jgi:hypothetical protein